MGTSEEDIRDILDLDSGAEEESASGDAPGGDGATGGSPEEDAGDPGVTPPEEIFEGDDPSSDPSSEGSSENGSSGEEKSEGEQLLEEFTGQTSEEETGTDSTEDNRPQVQVQESRSKELMQKAQKASPNASEETILRASNIIDQIEVMEQTRSAIGFDQSDLITEVVEEEMWELYGYENFSSFFRSNEVENISRSAAYRYKRVGSFMDEFPIGEEEFDDRFYEETDLEKVEVTDENGNVLEEETRQRNSLRNKLNFTDVEKVAGIYDQGKIDSAQAMELMKKSLNMLSEDFKEEIQKFKDEKDSTITEELNDRAINGPAIMVNAQNSEKAAENLGQIQTKLEQGTDMAREVLDDDSHQGIEKLGSKKVTFYERADGTVLIDF
ncbi:hypothetical protein [Salinibacter ruber]|uniref:Uncharacterized protein n=1 Tax=Salinibacter ruber TaxID=146919 RepID=A0AAW5P7M8_9BACT|nr:hypothetical protein [Salinibacter ruber]MCS4157615.1 hypothetical protein [Salinibacter ruber]